MSEQSEFLAITRTRYNNMRNRFCEVRLRDGTVLSAARELGFSLVEFRNWIRCLLGGVENGLVNCAYCNAILDLQTLQIDHRLPVSRGGSLGFENLAACCENCNLQKGEMSDAAFIALLNFIHTSHEFYSVDCENLLGRLQSQLKLALREQARRRAARQLKADHAMRLVRRREPAS